MAERSACRLRPFLTKLQYCQVSRSAREKDTTGVKSTFSPGEAVKLLAEEGLTSRSESLSLADSGHCRTELEVYASQIGRSRTRLESCPPCSGIGPAADSSNL